MTEARWIMEENHTEKMNREGTWSGPGFQCYGKEFGF